MAKDAPNKSTTSSNNNGNKSEDTSPSSLVPTDQQKVPPLKIVLNSTGNQKNSSLVNASSESADCQPNEASAGGKTQISKTSDNVIQRIRFSLQKPSVNLNKNKKSRLIASESKTEEPQKLRCNTLERSENAVKEESKDSTSSHLRRITRRSQRSVQTLNNEDEESVSSMTSLDETQSTAINNSDSNSAQDNSRTQGSQQQNDLSPTVTTISPPTTTTTTSATSSTSIPNSDAPRRHKKRKIEASETSPSEFDGFSGNNYKLCKNSIELYKMIRMQVDKKLTDLSSVHPKSPRGFRDFMLARGSYLLHGNKLGNGTNLFMNEDGGLHAAPAGRYHVLKRHRVNYTVPNRSRVPLGLVVNSPLYNLFIDQEKERHKMRMQHIKEREKLTLVAEQEIIRVHNQAAMAAANQAEPLSVCTMLKHQEIYNYHDADCCPAPSTEDVKLDPKPEGVRTRRRNYEQITYPPSRPTRESEPGALTDLNEIPSSSNQTTSRIEDQARDDDDESKKDSQSTNDPDRSKKNEPETNQEPTIATSKLESSKEGETDLKTSKDCEENKDSNAGVKEEPPMTLVKDLKNPQSISSEAKVKEEAMDVTDSSDPKDPMNPGNSTRDQTDDKTIDRVEPDDTLTARETTIEKDGRTETADIDPLAKNSPVGDAVLTDEDRVAYNRNVFLSQLQVIDDKWDKIRNEMLVRHRNEAESLHAVQRLEWEWRAKEVGACDVRNTLIIDDLLVPKLDIHLQDY